MDDKMLKQQAIQLLYIVCISVMLYPTLTKCNTVSLTKRQLTSIPGNISTDTTILYLDYNSMTELNTENLEDLQDLVKIYIAYNQLQSFPDLTPIASHIQRVYLRNNQISEIPYDLLNILVVLYEVDLQHNLITSIPDCPGPGNTLRHIWVHYNQITAFPVLTHLSTRMTYLGLYDNDLANTSPEMFAGFPSIGNMNLGKNGLTQFPNLTFVKTTLRYISLEHNDISYVPDALLSILTNLLYLNLYNNDIPGISDISGLPLKYLYLGINPIESYPTLNNLGPQIIRLNFHHLNWGNYDSSVFSMTPLLAEFYQYGNTARTIFPDFSVVAATMRIIDLRNNRISTLPYELLDILVALEMLRLSDNYVLSSFPNCIGPQGTLVNLQLSRNAFDHMPDLTVIGINLQYLLLHINNIASINNSHIEYFSAMKYLDLSQNALTHLPDIRPLFDTADRLYFPQNQIVHIPPEYFDFTNLANNLILKLDNNQIQTIPKLIIPESRNVLHNFDNNPLVCNRSLAWAFNKMNLTCYRPGSATESVLANLNLKEFGQPAVSAIQGRFDSDWETKLGDTDFSTCTSVQKMESTKVTLCSGFPSNLVVILADHKTVNGEYVYINVTFNGQCRLGELDVYSEETTDCTEFSSNNRANSSSREIQLCPKIHKIDVGNGYYTCGYKCSSSQNVIMTFADKGRTTNICDVSYRVE